MIPIGLSAAVAAGAWYWRRAWFRDQVRKRLEDTRETADVVTAAGGAFARRHLILPWFTGVIVSVAVVVLLHWPTNIAAGLGFVTALLLVQLDAWVLELRFNRIESQLADCVDVLVASVQAGASLQSALEAASGESRDPLRGELEEMVARLRLGDPAVDVFALLRRRVPVETFRLFCTTLTVNWEVGGGLAQTLASVGQTIRGRMAIARQVRTLSTQGRITTMSVLFVTYFLGAMMWQSDPARMTAFLATSVGQMLVTAVLVLQGVGIAMVAKISRPKV